MFESFRRFGKLLKYGLQGIIVALMLTTLIITIIEGLFFISVVEILARTVVWVISGYFETSLQVGISKANLCKMREYYTYYHLRKILYKI